MATRQLDHLDHLHVLSTACSHWLWTDHEEPNATAPLFVIFVPTISSWGLICPHFAIWVTLQLGRIYSRLDHAGHVEQLTQTRVKSRSAELYKCPSWWDVPERGTLAKVDVDIQHVQGLQGLEFHKRPGSRFMEIAFNFKVLDHSDWKAKKRGCGFQS